MINWLSPGPTYYAAQTTAAFDKIQSGCLAQQRWAEIEEIRGGSRVSAIDPNPGAEGKVNKTDALRQEQPETVVGDSFISLLTHSFNLYWVPFL